MGNHKSGTLGKLSRRVRRNREHAMRARGKREKAMTMEFFKRGFNLGSDMFKARILNATAGMEYEPETSVPDSGNHDDMSESTLGTVAPEPAASEPDIFHDENGDAYPASVQA